jgi:hypothetical protein
MPLPWIQRYSGANDVSASKQGHQIFNHTFTARAESTIRRQRMAVKGV